MMGETVNNIIGYTTNPKNRCLSCGGSSGGEGALIGLRGSVVGLGTDIGGSIRLEPKLVVPSKTSLGLSLKTGYQLRLMDCMVFAPLQGAYLMKDWLIVWMDKM